MSTPRRRLALAAAVLGVLAVGAGLALVLWPSGLDQLTSRDPHGGAACEVVQQWLTGELETRYGNVYEAAGIEGIAKLAAGSEAAAATTASIRATVTGDIDVPAVPLTSYSGDTWHAADLAALYDACTAEGVDMPPADGKI